jgi:hypothetical protein
VTVRIGSTRRASGRGASGEGGVLSLLLHLGRFGRLGVRGRTSDWAPFLGLDVGEAVELGELLAFLGSTGWPATLNRLDASLYEFVGVSSDVGPVYSVHELRAEVNRFAGMLLGYAVVDEEH